VPAPRWATGRLFSEEASSWLECLELSNPAGVTFLDGFLAERVAVQEDAA